MVERGLDVRGHRSRHLTQAIARGAWRIYASEEYQVEHAQALLPPGQQGKVMLLGGEEIPDPIGSGQAVYEAVAVQVERLIALAVADILAAMAAEDA